MCEQPILIWLNGLLTS